MVLKLVRSSFQAGRHQATKGDGLAKLVNNAGPSGKFGNRISGGVAHVSYAVGRVVDGFASLGRAPIALVSGPGQAAAAGGLVSVGGLVALYIAWGML